MKAGQWWLLSGLGVLAIVSLGIWASQPKPSPQQPRSVAAIRSFPLPSISESPFLNTKPDVQYVGSEACRSCHAEHEIAFRQTSMGRSMAEVDLSREPPDGAFDHPLSKRRYEVRREGGEMRHRELLLTDESEQVVMCDFPVKYVVGSGHHSLTYVVETDGYLVESPITWYSSRKAWGMSPGYDVAEHSGFERAVGEGCLTCHTSRAEAIDSSLHRMHIIEAAIGCERCHGPGSAHVKRRQNPPPTAAESTKDIDRTIVNPAHLPRDLSEAVCQQCHLHSSATVLARGRQFADFRPGLPLQEFRQDFWLDTPEKPMTVVGHVEQLHHSKCYQKSDKLTCLTCHSPHDVNRQAPSQPNHAICLSCHQKEVCRVDESRRRKESPGNDCVQCHMPNSKTEIPHLAFTHHRIGIHKSEDQSADQTTPATQPGALRPLLKTTWPSEVEEQRSFGLGYLEAANREQVPAVANEYRRRAFALMTNARSSGLKDPVLDASLARLHFDLKIPGGQALAESALAQKGLVGQDRCNALMILADSHLHEGRLTEAVAVVKQLNLLRRHSIHWLLLAECETKLNHDSIAQSALENAVHVNPRLREVHQALAERFAKAGDEKQAAWHKRRAAP